MLSTASPVNSSKLIFVIFEVLVWISCRRSLNVVSVLYQKPGDFKCLLVENKETLLTNSGFSASNHPRRPGGCQLGRDKRRRKGYYSKQTSSTTYSNACLWLGTKKCFCAQSGASIYRAAFVIFFTRPLDCSLYITVPVWIVQRSFLREDFPVRMGPQSRRYP